MSLRAARWWLLDSGSKNVWPRFWKATAVGYLCNFILPLRAGEVIRVLLLIRSGASDATRATVSSVVDRGTDVIIVSSLMVIALVMAPIPEIYASAGRVAQVILVASVVGLLVIVGLRIRAIRFGNESAKAGYLLNRIIGRLLLHLIDIIDQVGRHPLKLVSLAATIALVDIGGMWFVIRAVGWDLPATAALTFTVLLTFSTLLPSTPGYIGIYQVAAILSFGIYGIDATEAVAYSVLIQATTAISFILVGSLALISLAPWVPNKKPTDI